MNRYIPEKIRNQVADRAGLRCEYCQVCESDSFLRFEIDHIISLKHGGENDPENLAYACPHCNQNKGSDLATFLKSDQLIVGIFNPRKDNWTDHFLIENGEILGRSLEGQATIQLLKLNDPDRIILRRSLAELGRYP